MVDGCATMLTIGYACQKCGRTHSQSEFEESSYCRECSSFILKQFENSACSGGSGVIEGRSGSLVPAAENLRLRSEATKEYEVVTKPAEPKQAPGSADSWIFGCEFDDAMRLKTDLQQKFEGKTLEAAIHGAAVANQQGECYCITENHKIRFKIASAEESRIRLLSDLKVLPGIGPARERQLKAQGYRTIEDLTEHLKWQKHAAEYLQLVETKDVSALEAWLRRSLPRSHPLAHYLAGFCRDRDFAIIDIETLGLFGRPIILVGLAEAAKSSVRTRQFLARDVSEEAAAICELARTLLPSSAFVTFNGRSFDLPFIRERMAYYGLEVGAAFGNPHFDVLHFARRALKDKVASCRLESVERYLGIKRTVNIPGALVPEFYDAYQRTGNVGTLVAIVEHNKQDIITLARLFSSLYQEWGS